MQNIEIARRFEEVAELLRSQGANPHRALAYDQAALRLRRLDRPARDIYQNYGTEGLTNLAGIGPRLAYAVRDLLHTGRLPLLERLRGEGDAVRLPVLERMAVFSQYRQRSTPHYRNEPQRIAWL